MKQYKVNEDVLQATLNYLVAKPFAEVHQLIQALQTSEEVKEASED